MFASEDIRTVNVAFTYDPGADDVLPVWIAPKKCYIRSAHAVVANDIAASASDYFSVALRNGGSDGSGTTPIAAAVGGTPGWTGNTPKAFTIANGHLSTGDVVELVYDENGTATFGVLLVQLDVVYGEGEIPS